MSIRNPNNLGYDTIRELKAVDWNDPRKIVDLESYGVQFYDPEIMPSIISPLVHRALIIKGWCAPNAFPTYFPENQHELTQAWLNKNYHKLHRNGIHYLGNEPNFQPARNFDTKPLRVCFIRLSEYEILEGGFGQYLISNFVEDHDERVFFDYSFFPPHGDIGRMVDADIPLLTGVISKRPIRDFDLVLAGITIAEERLHLPLSLVRSGVALHRYQRFNQESPLYKSPVISMGGIGSLFSENILGDHPIHGPAQNGMTDVVSLGEGELMTLKLCQKFIQAKQAGMDKTDLLNTISADENCGVYNPTKVVFDYHDKTHVTYDFEGKQLSEPKVYPGAGPIRQVSLIDEENQQRYVLAGPGNDSYNELEAMQNRFLINFQDGVRGEDVGERYVRVDKRPTREERRRLFTKINGETAAATGDRFSVARARAEAIANGVEDVQAYILNAQREHEEQNAEVNLAAMTPRDAFLTELEKGRPKKAKTSINLLDAVRGRANPKYSKKDITQ